MASGGLWRDAWLRLARNRAAVAAACLLAVLVAASLVGPRVSPHAIDAIDWSLNPLASPPGAGHGHWFGTDANGRDLFVRVWSGTQVSLLVALLATAVSVV
jgi:oligopeptide transport system permease protein